VPERNAYPDGAPCWADVTTPDIEAAKRFYGELLGWTFVDSGPEFGGYVNCLKDGKAVAGMSPPQPGSDLPPAWSLYLWANDADAAAKRVEQGGGTVLMGPMEVGPMGRMLFATDPTGAAFGLWEPGEHRGAQLHGEPGALSWAEVNTRDAAGADAFYQHLFGYEQEQIGDGEGFDYTVWRLEGEPVCGRLKMTEQWGDIPPHWMVYFGVEDVDAAIGRVRGAGGNVNVEPFDTTSGRIAVVSDPSGIHFSIVKPVPPAAS
jgi:predicted enzyme related to lactoylglutathione lyase